MELSELADDVLMEALRYHGGDGIDGAARILIRSGVAALLNACSYDVAFPMSVASVIDAVNNALATLDREEMLALYEMFDTYNNLGCSIDAHCLPIEWPPDRSLDEDHITFELLKPEFEAKDGRTTAWSYCVPNPFGESTNIVFGLPTSGAVKIDIYNVAGRHVTSLVDGQRTAGTHEVVWNGRSSDGSRVPDGVYFYRISLGTETLSRKLIVMK
jgi:hypothetical protein